MISDPRRIGLVLVTTVAVTAAGLSWSVSAQRGGQARSGGSPFQAAGARLAPAFTARDLVALPGANWVTSGGNVYNQRYSPATRITRENVANLKAVWRVHLNGSGVGPKYSGQGQPLVYDGIIYQVTGADDVFAVDLQSGRLLWQYTANLDPGISTICCGWTNRGVALGEGKVYVGQLDGKLVALDQRTGKVVWSVQAERWQDGYTITAAPLYINGLVITGFAGAEMVTRGRVKAYSAEDGAPAWTFYTIPAPGEKGNETWPAGGDEWKSGGGSVWNTPAADPALGLIYFQTGNPNPDFNGGKRAGDNLFTSSVVALDVKTGTYRWHFQEVHHDIWDYDAATPIVLFDAPYQGRTRKALAAAGKTGWLYILDRETGAPLVGIEERPVMQEPRQATSKTQPFPVGDAFVSQDLSDAPKDYPLVNGGRIFTPHWMEGAAFKPGPLGGANWPMPAYNPKTRLLYVCANDMPGHLSATEYEDGLAEGAMRTAGRMGRGPQSKMAGVIAAMDVTTNRKRWAVESPGDLCMNALSATATGLVFVGRNDGRVTALDGDSGTQLWSFQTDAGVSAPATVVDYQGEQYVVVFSAGTVTSGSVRGDSVWLFSLRGTMGPTGKPSTVVSLPAGLGGMRAVVPALAPKVIEAVQGRTPDVDAGKVTYTQACMFCHGARGEGGAHGPAFGALPDLAAVMTIVADGRGAMPKFGLGLTPDQIQDAAAYVLRDLAKH